MGWYGLWIHLSTVKTKLVRQFLSLLLSIGVALHAPLSLANDSKGPSDDGVNKVSTENLTPKQAVAEVLSSTVTQVIEHPQDPSIKAEISVSTIETDKQDKVIKEIVKQADGPVVVIHSPEELEQVKEMITQLPEVQDVKIIEVAAPDKRSFKQKFFDSIHAVKAKFAQKKQYIKENKEQLKTAMMVNIAINTGVAGLTYYITSDVVDTVGITSVLFITSTLRSVFTDTWIRYLDRGGAATQKFFEKVAGAIDYVLASDTQTWVKAHERAGEVTGSIFAAATVASLTFLAAKLAAGDLAGLSVETLALMALLGGATAYDYVTFDVAGRYLLKNNLISQKTYNWMIRVATVYGPSVDAVFFTNPHYKPVQYVVVGTGVVALILSYQGERVFTVVSSSGKRTLKSIDAIRNLAVKSINSIKKPVSGGRSSSCSQMLSPTRYDQAGRIPYEDAS